MFGKSSRLIELVEEYKKENNLDENESVFEKTSRDSILMYGSRVPSPSAKILRREEIFKQLYLATEALISHLNVEKKSLPFSKEISPLHSPHQECIFEAENIHKRYYGRFQNAARSLQEILSTLSVEKFAEFINQEVNLEKDITFSNIELLREQPIVILIIFLCMSGKSALSNKELIDKLIKSENIYLYYQEFLDTERLDSANNLKSL